MHSRLVPIELLTALFMAALLTLAMACGDDEEEGCGGVAQGETKPCTCIETGLSGQQTCLPNGEFAECYCEPVAGSGGLDSGTSVGTGDGGGVQTTITTGFDAGTRDGGI